MLCSDTSRSPAAGWSPAGTALRTSRAPPSCGRAQRRPDCDGAPSAERREVAGLPPERRLPAILWQAVLEDVVAVAWDGFGSFGLGVVGGGVRLRPHGRRAAGLRLRGGRRAPGPGAHATPASVLRSSTAWSGPRPPTSSSRWAGSTPEAVPSEAVLPGVPRRAVDRGARVMSHCSGAYVLAASGRARRPHRRDALDVRRRPGAALPGRHRRPRRALRRRRPGVLQRGHGGRHRHLPAPAAPRARRRGGQRRSPGGWSCRPTATAGRRSTSRRRCRTSTRTPGCARCSRGRRPTSTSRSRSRSSPPGRSCRRAASRGTSARRPASSPHAWLLAQRIALAQELLEQSDLGVEEVARRSGFGAPTTLRHHFALRVGTSPQAYRRTFRGSVTDVAV